MIPDSAAALLAFLGLLAPGLVFGMRRQRRRPQDTETTLQEAGRIALTSLVFTVSATLALLFLAATWSALPDIEQWAADPGPYAKANPSAIGLFLLLELMLACLLALVLEAATSRSMRGNIVPGGIWYMVLRQDVPVGATRIWLRIVTADGSQYKGPLRGYTPASGDDGAGIALGGSPISWLPASKDLTRQDDWTHLQRIDAVVIPASEIRHVVVTYLNQKGESLAATPKRSGWEAVKSAWPRRRNSAAGSQ